MTKVMVVIPALGTGGGEKIAIDIAANVDKRKIEVLVVSLYEKKDTILDRYAMDLGLNVVYLDKKIGFDAKVIGRLHKVYKEFKPDVIHTHLYVGPYVFFATPRKVKKIHTVHNLAEKEATGLLRTLMLFGYKMWNVVPVAISPLCARTISDLYHIELQTIPCIMNGIDINRFNLKRTVHQKIRFLNVGRFYPQKNQKLLIEAFKRVHSCIEETELELVGDVDLRKKLENQIESLGLSGTVIMNGETDRVDLKLNNADVFVMSSDFEGLPVSVLEAMASGLPIVSTAAGGTVDIVEHEENGLIVDVGNGDQLAEAMIRLAHDKELRITMGKKSRKMAEQYSIEKCSEAYQKLYLNKDWRR